MDWRSWLTAAASYTPTHTLVQTSSSCGHCNTPASSPLCWLQEHQILLFEPEAAPPEIILLRAFERTLLTTMIMRTRTRRRGATTRTRIRITRTITRTPVENEIHQRIRNRAFHFNPHAVCPGLQDSRTSPVFLIAVPLQRRTICGKFNILVID